MFSNLAGLVAVLWQCVTFGAFAAPVPSGPPLPRTQAVCSVGAPEAAACEAKVRADNAGSVKPFATFNALPSGYSPQQLRTAYGATTSNSSIAVVTAYDSPNAKKDLDTYDATFGLGSFPNCTTPSQTACFSKVNQYGSNFFFPFRNRGWAMEADLDVQIAHAMCPGCRLTLVEANSPYFSDLTRAIDQAGNSGAKVVSMSWGGDEFSFESVYDNHFSNPGVEFVAASGDGGYGTSWPASSTNVLSAGGTSLQLDSSGKRTSETAWSGSGSGCSLYEAKPGWQKDKGCANRTLNDAAADADPFTGAAIYSSYSPYGPGWFIIGGTSLSTPLLGGIIADAPAAANQSAFFTNLYGAASGLNDVLSGSNGTCSPAYLCTALPGYDGPTGVGSPNGLSAF